MQTQNNVKNDIARQYLAHRGYDILEADWESGSHQVDVIAKDGNILVFASVVMSEDSDDGFLVTPRTDAVREKREAAANAYIKGHADIRDMRYRFDDISIKSIDEERKLVRHNLNSLGVVDFSESMAEAA